MNLMFILSAVSHFYLLLLHAPIPVPAPPPSLPTWWMVATVIIGPLISAAVALTILRINQRTTETNEERKVRLELEQAEQRTQHEIHKNEQQFKKTTQENHDATRNELLALIKTQSEALKQAEVTRLHRDLSQDKDFAQITGILQKSTEVQQQQLSISTHIENLKASDQRHDRNHESMTKTIGVIQSNILQLVTRYPQSSHPTPNA